MLRPRATEELTQPEFRQWVEQRVPADSWPRLYFFMGRRGAELAPERCVFESFVVEAYSAQEAEHVRTTIIGNSTEWLLAHDVGARGVYVLKPPCAVHRNNGVIEIITKQQGVLPWT